MEKYGVEDKKELLKQELYEIQEELGQHNSGFIKLATAEIIRLNNREIAVREELENL